MTLCACGTRRQMAFGLPRDVIWLKRYYFDRTRDDDIVLFEHHGEAEEEVIGTESKEVIEDAEEAEVQYEV